MNKFEFGNMLRELRIRKKLRIRDVEKLSDVSNSYLSFMERGERDIPSPDILKKLAPVYSIEYIELMKLAGYITDKEEAIEKLKAAPDGTALIDAVANADNIDINRLIKAIESGVFDKD